jgi:hypothetical protein
MEVEKMKAKPVLVAVVLCLLPGQWAQAELFNDGGVHDILSGTYGDVVVDSPPPVAPAFTTINWGGTAVTRTLKVFNYGRVTVDGGMSGALSAYDNSRVTLNSGDRYDGRAWHVYDNSQLTMNGGGFMDVCGAYDNTELTMNGGNLEYLLVGGHSRMTWNDGGISDAYFLDNTQVTINGGGFNAFIMSGNGRVTMNGGMGGALGGFNIGETSRATINNGFFGTLYTGGDSRATLNGGDGWVEADGNSRVTVNDGEISGLTTRGSSQITVNGGAVQADLFAWDNGSLRISGADFPDGLMASATDNGLITFVGSNFSVYRNEDRTDLVFSGYGDLTSSFDGCWLWGTLAGGDSFGNLYLGIEGEGQISLVPVPGAVLLGLLGLSVAGWRLRRRTT